MYIAYRKCAVTKTNILNIFFIAMNIIYAHLVIIMSVTTPIEDMYTNTSSASSEK